VVPASIPLLEFRSPATGRKIFIKSWERYLPARHQPFTAGRHSLRMSDGKGSGLSRRQAPAAGGTGLLADGTPEQVHLTWGDDPARSVVVSWASPGQAVAPRVRIGQRIIAAARRGSADGLNGEITWTYHARVDGLRPGATYGYAVTADNDRCAADPFSATFTTAPQGRAAFRFTSFGDLATPGLRQEGLSGQAAYAVGSVETFQPLFHLLNGNVAYASPRPAARPRVWRDFGNSIAASAAYRPWMPVPGSHEPEPGHGDHGLASYLARYTLPSNGLPAFEGRWYEFRVGTVAFVCLSGDDAACQDAGAIAGAGAGGYSGGAQARWLEATLAAARRDASIDWIVASLHQCACSPVLAGHGSDLGVRQQWLPLFDRYEVDLVLCGHDHGYERSFPVRGFEPAAGPAAGTGWPHPVTTVDSGVFDTSAGTVHLVLGRGGRPAADAAGTAAWSARRDTAAGYGIAVFDVSPGTGAGGQTSITVRYYHAAGADPALGLATSVPGGDYTLFETFTLVRPRSDGRRWHAR
jgi:3',5'-cyclic AMP phosphodiesterase CpdA